MTLFGGTEWDAAAPQCRVDGCTEPPVAWNEWCYDHQPPERTDHQADVRSIARDPVTGAAWWDTDDPAASSAAAGRVEPRRGTRKALVLGVLRDRSPEWVPGHVLAAPEVGGSEGLRRARELRAQGWPIDLRPMRSGSSWEYRYGEPPGEGRSDGG